MPSAGLDHLRRKALERLRYETLTSNAWYVLRRSLAPLARLDLWLICRRDLTKPLPPRPARLPIEVRPASDAELAQAARLDGAGGEDYAEWLRSWVRAGNACFVAKVGSDVVARGLLGTGNLHFEDYCIGLADGEVYLTGGYTAQAWRGRRIHLELEYQRMLWAQRAGARAAYTLVSVDNTRSMRNSFRTGYEAAGLVLCSKAGRSGSPRMWRLRGSLHPIRLAGRTAMDQLLADNDVFEFEGCLLVVPRREPRLFLLNATARLMWQELARGVPPDEVADGLAARFDVPPAQVRADMTAILAEWSAHKLLTEAPRPDGAAPIAAPATAGADPRPARRSVEAERVYRLCGRPIRVRCDAPEIEQAIHPPLAHAEDPSSAPSDTIEVVRDGAGYLVVCNGSDVERTASEEEALGQVYGRILELSYPDAEWLAMMHAGAVGDERGAVVMPADSGSGKSTLTAALVHAGLRYFSDDVVPLDAGLRIRPMPLGVSLKEGSWPVLATRYPELEGLPIHPGRRRYLPVAVPRHGPQSGLPVQSLVFPRYRPDQPMTMRRLTALELLEKLASARSWIALDGRRFGSTLRWIEETPGYDLGYASLEEAVLAIDGLLDGEDRANRPQRHGSRGETRDG